MGNNYRWPATGDKAFKIEFGFICIKVRNPPQEFQYDFGLTKFSLFLRSPFLH
jgi:hypothetical protein